MFFGREFADEVYKELDSMDDIPDNKEDLVSVCKAYSDFMEVKKAIVAAIADKHTDVHAILDTLRNGTGGNVYFDVEREKNNKLHRKYDFHFDHCRYDKKEIDAVEDDSFYDECPYIEWFNDWDYYLPKADKGKSFILFKVHQSLKDVRPIYEDYKAGKITVTEFREKTAEEKVVKNISVDMQLLDVGANLNLYSLSRLPKTAAKRIMEYLKENNNIL